jgi:thiamine-phosphate pyrophosphorylase
MLQAMLRYAITGEEYLLGDAERLAADGVDFVQLRMKNASASKQVHTARTILENLKGSATKLLINGRADVALAVGAEGVHLTAWPGELTPQQVRSLFAQVAAPRPVISVSCHTLDDVRRAQSEGADWMLFGPVFEKRVAGEVVVAGVGLDALREAVLAAPGKVLALGGVTTANTAECIAAGAAGVAGIRLFA